MATVNQMCTVDGVKDAVGFCMCESKEAFLCEEHVASHISKALDRGHFIFPMALYSHRSEGSYAQVLSRYRAKAELVAEVRKNVDRFDQCIEEARRATDEIIESMRRAADALLTELTTARTTFATEVEAAVAEYESSIAFEAPPLQHEIALAMRTYAGDPFTLQFFEYGLVPRAPASLPEVVRWRTRTGAQPAGEALVQRPLAIVDGHIVKFVEDGTMEVVELDMDEDLGSRYATTVLSGSAGIYVSGGVSANLVISSSVFTISDAVATRQRSMLSRRFCHGLFHAQEWPYVFIFGGESQQDHSPVRLAACERAPVSTLIPEAILDMPHPRSAFNPCHHRNAIYLCGGYGAEGAIDIYNPGLNLFSTASTRLPEDSSLSTGVTTTAIDDSLFIISSAKVVKWQPESDSVDWERPKPASSVWSTCTPVLFARQVLVVCHDGVVRRISIDTGAVEAAPAEQGGCQLA